MTEAAKTIDPVLTLYDCLLEFGRQQSNPVLAVLAGEKPLGEHKYPPGDHLEFGSDAWRAFYHSHFSPGQPGNEHGHFHLFAPVDGAGKAGWTHVAALSMDNLGQPLRWFAVNRWVTDGTWLDAGTLASIAGSLEPLSSQPLLARWLASMVAVFHEEIVEMLETRDRQLTRVNETQSGPDSLENREVYLLADRPVDLLATLQERIRQ
jgi:hypothetical protein